MGFKTDTSFLQFLSIGAAGIRQTVLQLRGKGFKPIELERYCASNNIWMTKVKRLRLPDLLCVQTGTRFEVRAKSDLKIRMSDAPANPDRAWDAGLRDDDLIAFIASFDENGTPRPAREAVFFDVRSLRETALVSKLGPPKSASEGAERDRTWPSTVPNRSGTVLEVSENKIVVAQNVADNASRKQTYRLDGKSPYVIPGDRFTAGSTFLAGAPSKLASIDEYLGRAYDPVDQLSSTNVVDRYAAAKALSHRTDLQEGREALERLIARETDERVALEAAAAANRLNSPKAENFIDDFIATTQRADLRMEAVLILAESPTSYAHRKLLDVARDPANVGNEIRQAAVWGLGWAGHGAFEDLLEFIEDEDDGVAMHAIAAFGREIPAGIVTRLVTLLKGASDATAASASEILRISGSPVVFDALLSSLSEAGGASPWVLATLGLLPPKMVSERLASDADLIRALAPIFTQSADRNWLRTPLSDEQMKFLLRQNI